MNKWINLILLAAFLAGCSGANKLYTGSPEPLTCLEGDLPGYYLLLEDLTGARTNEGLVSQSRDLDATNEYIQTTGRLEGWEKRFMLTEPTAELPGYILCEVVTFETSEGAVQALNWPDPQTLQPYETDRQIGDEMLVTWVEFNAPDNSLWHDYRVEFTYQNVLGIVHTYAPAEVAKADYALDIAEKMLGRFENPPEAAAPTPAP